jgi:hypothetical protein
MEQLSETECIRMNKIMRSIQRRFVVAALAEEIGPHSQTDGLDVLVSAVARKCRSNGTMFSDDLVRELIIEISQELGYEGSEKRKF